MDKPLTSDELALLKSYGCEYPWVPQQTLKLIRSLQELRKDLQAQGDQTWVDADDLRPPDPDQRPLRHWEHPKTPAQVELTRLRAR